MTKITEEQLEHICLDWIRTGGYDSAFGPDISPCFFDVQVEPVPGHTIKLRHMTFSVTPERLYPALT